MNANFENVTPASEELFQVICDRTKTERGVHIETAISAAGYLAGARALRNTGIDFSQFQPGAPILVDSVNEVGPELIGLMEALCNQSNLGQASNWLMEVPVEHQPLMSSTELLEDLEPAFSEIQDRYHIDNVTAPYIGVQAIYRFILAGQQVLNPDLGKSIATEAIVRGAKSVPPQEKVLVAAG